MDQPPDAPLELNPAALRAFVAALESQVENRMRTAARDLDARFFPAGRGDEQRPFGRSPHHPGQRDLGITQQHNVAAHVDELTRLREALTALRHSAQELRTDFQEAEHHDEALHRGLNDVTNELRESRWPPLS